MRYRISGERTELKVSELALGTGMFGQTWGYGAPPEDVKRILAAYADAGGKLHRYRRQLLAPCFGDTQ